MFKIKVLCVLGLALVVALGTVAISQTENDQASIQAAKGKGAAKKAVVSYVPKTGQTISYAVGDDGDLQKGLPWPEPRYVDNGDGTVTDRLTELMWTQNGQVIPGQMDWYSAVQSCNDLVFAGYDDWRLPNIREMLSLVDFGTFLTPPDPFTTGGGGWTSTSLNNAEAYVLIGWDGRIGHNDKVGLRYLRPVRGGKDAVLARHLRGMEAAVSR